MSEQITTVPLSNLVRLGLPPGSTYLVGNEQRNKIIRWVTAVGVPLRRAEMVEEGDLVIVAVRGDGLNWSDTMQQFAELGVAALAFNERPSDIALQMAERADIPIILMPEGSDLRGAHRGALTLLLKQEAQVAQRAREIARRLNHLATEDVDFLALGLELVNLIGHGVIMQDKRMKCLVSERPATIDAGSWRQIQNKLSDLNTLPSGWADRRLAAKNRGRVERQQLADGYARLVTPIVVQDLARGYLSIIAQQTELDSLDEMVVEQGASAYALAMSKAKAVSEAAKRIRGDFIDAILANTVPAAELERWARRLGYNITTPHAVVIFAWGQVQPKGLGISGNLATSVPPAMPSQRRLETLVNGEIGLARQSALVRNTDTEVAAFVALDDATSLRNVRNLAESVYEQASQEQTHARLYCGIGRPVVTIHEWSVSYREAMQSMDTARRLDESRPLFFGDLSVHRLLFQMQGQRELQRFCEETIGQLVEYDKKHNSMLVKTLSIYFENLGNLTQTADALYIHRNTLQYRMDRIADIAKIDIDNPDTRLAVQLALKAYKLLEG
jgi:purine catabolism regulator